MTIREESLNGIKKVWPEGVPEDEQSDCATHHYRLMDRQDAMVTELKSISGMIAQLINQQAEERKELIDELRGKTPQRYVPLSVYYITITVALGVSQLTGIVQLFWGQK